MSDIKLFRIGHGGADELPASPFAIEKGLQSLVEKNLVALLGIRFLASEYATGKTHSGRIDTLGIDENNCPVIVEYKRSTNENVINQGLFYLDWLLDHKAEFTLHAMKVLGSEIEQRIDWSAPRLVCVAGDFTRYDEHAVQQINRNIELVRYRNYDDGFLILELVNATTGTHRPIEESSASSGNGTPRNAKTVTEYHEQASPELRMLFASLENYALGLGDDVTVKTLKYYYAFRRIKNFACVEIHPQTGQLLVFLKVDPSSVDVVEGFSRDVSKVGHFGTGDLELRLSSVEDLERAKPLMIRSYEAS
jgi:predicted transport protein